MPCAAGRVFAGCCLGSAAALLAGIPGKILIIGKIKSGNYRAVGPLALTLRPLAPRYITQDYSMPPVVGVHNVDEIERGLVVR